MPEAQLEELCLLRRKLHHTQPKQGETEQEDWGLSPLCPVFLRPLQIGAIPCSDWF